MDLGDVPGKMDGAGVPSGKIVGLSVHGITPSQSSLPTGDEEGARELLLFSDGGTKSKISGPTSKGIFFQNFLSIPGIESL